MKGSLLFAVVLLATASSLSTSCIAQDNPNYHKSRTRPVIPFKHATLAAPPGMVYVPGGSVTIKYSQSSTDTNSKKRVSLSSFYIDKTEITNQQYRMFTEWVIDSVAVTTYLKDDKYFLDPSLSSDEDKDNKKSDKKNNETAATAPTDSTGRALAAADSALSAAPKDTSAKAGLASANVTFVKKDSVRRRINWARVDHKAIFESNDDEIKKKIAPMYDPKTGKIREDLYTFNFTYLRASGTNKNIKVGEYTTQAINIYPDEKIWFKDLSNSQVEILVENYFTQPPFDDYPVVGVNWVQARAYAYWRSNTNFDYAYIADYLKYYHLVYSLPSEAQWVYAAGEDMNELIKNGVDRINDNNDDSNPVVNITDSSNNNMAAVRDSANHDSTATVAAVPTTTKQKQPEQSAQPEPEARLKSDDIPVDRDKNGNLLVNFKQEEGDYTADGATFTLPVMSYAPNKFGVYNMVGNVSEWVLDAYSPSAFAFVSDVNPVLLYDADSTDADAMKRKVVRGGSFVSNAKALSPFSRDQELQTTSHCYIGFRCVMPAPEILNKSVATRRGSTGMGGSSMKRNTGKK